MKEKLLVTLGCSFTEGVGCWIKETPNDVVNGDHKIWEYYYRASKKSFHENGWPYKLGRLMGFDKVVNFGWGGSSISGNVKHWFQAYSDKDLSKYDVTIVWLLPSVLRTSNYINGEIVDELVSESNSESIIHNWIKKSKDFEWDSTLEALFHIKIMASECKLKGINLIIFKQDEMKFFHPLKYNRDDIKFYSTWMPNLLQQKELVSPCCGHFNEEGYTQLARNMYDKIKSIQPHILGEPLPIDKKRPHNERWIDRIKNPSKII